MSEEANGKPPQPGQVQVNAQINPQGVMLACDYPVQFGLPPEMMDALAKEWILQRPALLLEVAQRAKQAQKQELAIIRHINSRRND